MSRNTGEDFSASPETELLLSNRACNDMPTSTCAKARPDERRATDELQHRGSASSSSSSPSSSRVTSQDKSGRSSRNMQVEEPSSNPVVAITSPSIIVNDAVENDDPPPYVSILPPHVSTLPSYGQIPPPYNAIAPPNHVGWPYSSFSFGDSYSVDAPSYTVEMPLAPFQTSRESVATGFHPEETNRQHASIPMSLTPYRFLKFSYSGEWRETWHPRNRIAEKIEDITSRKYGAILVAAAVMISLMALSLMVRFIVERSWWRQ